MEIFTREWPFVYYVFCSSWFNQKPDHQFLSGISTLLLLFQEDSKSVAMIYHAMTKLNEVVALLNPNQILFVTLDQPFYTVA